MRLSRGRAAMVSMIIGTALVPIVGRADVANAAPKTYMLGCEGPLTGPNARFGLSACRAVELAAHQANQAGSLPYHLGVLRLDDQGDPVHAPATATIAVNDFRLLAVVGPDFSGTALAAEPIYGNAHLLAVSPSATNPDVTRPRRQSNSSSFFRAVASDTDEGRSAGRYVAHLSGIRRVAVVDDGTDYGTTETRLVRRTLHARGIAVTRGRIGFDAGHSHYVHEARRIADSGAGAVYFGGYDVPAGKLAKALHRAGYAGRFIGDDGARTPLFIKHAGKAAAASAQFTSPFVPDASYGPARKFAKQFRDRFDKRPGEPAVEAFDAANSVIQDLMTQSATPTRRAVVSAYRSSSWRGIANLISYTHHHDLRQPKIFRYGVSGRRIVFAHALPG